MNADQLKTAIGLIALLILPAFGCGSKPVSDSWSNDDLGSYSQSYSRSQSQPPSPFDSATFKSSVMESSMDESGGFMAAETTRVMTQYGPIVIIEETYETPGGGFCKFGCTDYRYFWQQYGQKKSVEKKDYFRWSIRSALVNRVNEKLSYEFRTQLAENPSCFYSTRFKSVDFSSVEVSLAGSGITFCSSNNEPELQCRGMLGVPCWTLSYEDARPYLEQRL